LNVGISKKLLNDRLKVTEAALAWKDHKKKKEASTIAGDVAIEYQPLRTEDIN
jgi:hypothetical protein